MRTSDQFPDQTPQGQPLFTERLDSWKEIATYFDRDVRTVRRWESERDLPIHRLPGERGGVFAYVGELEQWRHRADTAATDDRHAAAPVATEVTATEFAPATPVRPEDIHIPVHPGIPRRWLGLPIAAWTSAAILLITVVGVVAHRRHVPPVVRVAAKHVPLPQAQELDLEGRYFWNLRTEADLNHAVELFTGAIAHDPAYAPPYAGLADSYILLRQFGHMPDAEAFPRALAAADHAVALDDSLPAGHRARAFVLDYWNWDFAQADREFQRAVELDRNSAQTHHWYASALWSQGRVEEARQQIDQARALDPESVTTIYNRALFFEAADPEGALRVWRDLERTTPGYAPVHEQLGFRDLVAGDYSGFLTEWQTLAQLRNDPLEMALLKSSKRTLERSGPEAMLQQLAKGFTTLADQGGESPLLAAHFAMLNGDRTGALHELELAYQRHDPSVLTANVDGVFTPLHSTKEFTDLVARWASRTRAG